MNEFSTCPKCDFEIAGPPADCPQCGRRTVSSIRIRRLGWFSLILGSFLTIFMSGLSVLIGSLIYQANHPGSTTRVNITSEQITAMYGLFGVIIAIGLTSIFAGIWQIKHGKRNKMVMYVTIGLIILFVLGIFAVTAMFPT